MGPICLPLRPINSFVSLGRTLLLATRITGCRPHLTHPETTLPRLDRQSKKLADAEEAVLARKELENVIADLRRQLGQAQAEVSTLQVRDCAAARPLPAAQPCRTARCSWLFACCETDGLLERGPCWGQERREGCTRRLCQTRRSGPGRDSITYCHRRHRHMRSLRGSLCNTRACTCTHARMRAHPFA